MDYSFGDKYAAAELLGCHPDSLARSRRNANYGWIEGVHFVRLNSSSVRYNLTLLQDWLMNRHNQLAHQRAVEAYYLVISHQKKSRKRVIV
jgi:hypothetical protein